MPEIRFAVHPQGNKDELYSCASTLVWMHILCENRARLLWSAASWWRRLGHAWLLQGGDARLLGEALLAVGNVTRQRRESKAMGCTAIEIEIEKI